MYAYVCIWFVLGEDRKVLGVVCNIFRLNICFEGGGFKFGFVGASRDVIF